MGGGAEGGKAVQSHRSGSTGGGGISFGILSLIGFGVFSTLSSEPQASLSATESTCVPTALLFASAAANTSEPYVVTAIEAELPPPHVEDVDCSRAEAPVRTPLPSATEAGAEALVGFAPWKGALSRLAALSLATRSAIVFETSDKGSSLSNRPPVTALATPAVDWSSTLLRAAAAALAAAAAAAAAASAAAIAAASTAAASAI